MDQVICRGWLGSRLFVALLFASMIGAAFYLMSQLINGYWLKGTYGFLVLMGLAAIPFVARDVLGIFLSHIVHKSPLIFIKDGSVHYMQVGRKSVPLRQIANVQPMPDRFFNFLAYIDKSGNEIARHPLALSRENQENVIRSIYLAAGLNNSGRVASQSQ